MRIPVIPGSENFLTGFGNWNWWKRKTSRVLQEKGVWEHVKLPPEKVQVEMYDKEFRKKDNVAKHILVDRLDEPHLSLLLGCNFAPEMWRKLVTTYEGERVHKVAEQVHYPKWFASSWASHHLVKNRYWLDNYKKYDEPIRVKGKRGEIISGVGVGDVRVRMYNGKKWFNGILKDVVLAPDLGEEGGVLAVNQMAVHGYMIGADSASCVIMTGDGHVVLLGSRVEDGIHELKLRSKRDIKRTINLDNLQKRFQNL